MTLVKLYVNKICETLNENRKIVFINKHDDNDDDVVSLVLKY